MSIISPIISLLFRHVLVFYTQSLVLIISWRKIIKQESI